VGAANMNMLMKQMNLGPAFYIRVVAGSYVVGNKGDGTS